MRQALWLGVGLVIASTGIGYLNSVGIVAAIVTPTPSVTLAGAPPGAALNVVTVQQSLSVHILHAEDFPGIELYRIDIGPTTLSNHLMVSFAWLDPQDATGLLHNPHAFILVGLYDKASNAPTGTTCLDGQVYANDPTNGAICLAPDGGPQASSIVTRKIADTTLQASQTPESAVYIVGAIEKPEGEAFPGQQSQLTSLQFFANARLGGL